MALEYQSASLSLCNSVISKPQLPYSKGPIFSSVASSRRRITYFPVLKCVADTKVSDENNNIIRRSANYQPPIWHFDYVQSLKSPFTVRI